MSRSVLSRFSRAAVLHFILAVASLAPAYAQDGVPVFPPASRIGLAPPPDFVVSRNFVGFQHNDKQASILMAELPGYTFETIEKEVTAGMQNDPTAVGRADIELKDGGRGFVLFGRPSGPQGPVLKWTLVARVRDVTAIVTAMIPQAVQETASDQAIRAALASLTVRTAVPLEEQLSVLPFDFTDFAGFRIVRVQPGSAAMLTDGPKDAVEASEQPLLVISILPGPSPETPERDGVARRLFGEIPGLKDVKVVRAEPLRMIGAQGHEILVDAKDAKTGVDLNAVQWLRFGTGALVRLVGIARKDTWDQTFRRFRSLRDGIQPK